MTSCCLPGARVQTSIDPFIIMMRTAFSSWKSLWDELKLAGRPVIWHSRLIDAYSEKHRAYHNVYHLDDCLRELDTVKKFASLPAAIEAALWFHDSVYDPRSSSNEEESAALAAVCLTEANAAEDLVENVRQLILCTKSHRANDQADAALLIDIDLSIFGQPPARFWSYERGIRTEYAWVPEHVYAEKRAEILHRFLQGDTLYHTPVFRSLYETTARGNLAAAIERLRHLKSHD